MYSKLIIIGALGRDPEMRYTPSGQAVCNFSVATDESYVKDGQKVKKTTWWRVSTWGKQAETCNQYLKKGSKVLVEGKITADDNGNPRIFNKSDGTASTSFEVNASVVRFLSSVEHKQDADAIDGAELPF